MGPGLRLESQVRFLPTYISLIFYLLLHSRASCTHGTRHKRVQTNKRLAANKRLTARSAVECSNPYKYLPCCRISTPDLPFPSQVVGPGDLQKTILNIVYAKTEPARAERAKHRALARETPSTTREQLKQDITQHNTMQNEAKSFTSPVPTEKVTHTQQQNEPQPAQETTKNRQL